MTTSDTQAAPALANDLLDRLGRTVGRSASASAVFGEAVERDGTTVIPVARARFGFGGGAGDGTPTSDGSGGGGGGGASVSPVGYIEIRGGAARFKRILNPLDVLALVGAVSLAALAVRRLAAGT